MLYVSPFVVMAEQRANERAKLALQARRSSRKPREWNSDTSAPSLFDPNLKKQEIFKLQPRKPSTATDRRELQSRGTVNAADTERPETLAPTARKLTMKSFGVRKIHASV